LGIPFIVECGNSIFVACDKSVTVPDLIFGKRDKTGFMTRPTIWIVMNTEITGKLDVRLLLGRRWYWRELLCPAHKVRITVSEDMGGTP
jgi:hypothetical protein